jgi:hypothetical protein
MPFWAICQWAADKFGLAAMNVEPIRTQQPGSAVLLAALAATVLLTLAIPAAAQQPPAPPEAPSHYSGFFGAIGRWVDRQTESLRSTFQDAGTKVGDIGQEAGAAARTTVDNAKDVGDAVKRIPDTRVVSGHEACKLAPNGAPDCLAAADAVCKAKGYKSGKSVDMTTAEVCPTQVYLAGRTRGEGCHTETFVSRALCQ